MVLAEEYSLLYDANGNLVYDQETDIYREYNELNQLIRTRINNASGTILQEYVWDPIKEEIFIKDEFYSNGSLKSSTYYFGQDYIVIQNSSGTFNRTNIYQDGVLVGYEDFDGRKRYVLPDHKGSAHIILNESGDVIEENLFSPFAEPLQGVIENKFSYEAKEYDNLVKDYDFHFRKYDPKLRIFTQPDTLIQNVYDPQLLNRYAFERSNPLKNVDENGHQLAHPYLAVMIILSVLVMTAYFRWAGISRDPDQDIQYDDIVRDVENQIREQETENKNNQPIPQDNVIEPDYEINIEFNPEDLVLEDEDKKDEEIPFYCKNCIKKDIMDPNGNIITITMDAQGKELYSTKSYNSGASNNCPCYLYGTDEEGNVIAIPVTPYEPSPAPEPST